MRGRKLAGFCALSVGLLWACAEGNETDPTDPSGPAGPGGSGGSGASGGSVTGPGGAGGQGGSCEEGYADCDGEPGNGCEIYTVSHALHCGQCDNPCPTGPNASANCSDSLCVFNCQMGFEDCDADTTTGCEAFLATDNDHCGACNTPCIGTCIGGVCDPSSDVVTAQNHPLFITSDSTNLYWVNVGTTPNYSNGTLMQMPINGTTPQLLVSAIPFPSELAVDSTDIYYAAYGATGNPIGYVATVPIGGGTPVQLAPAEAAIGLAIDSTHVYWANAGANPGSGSIQRVLKTGGTVETIVPNLTTAFAVALDSTYVYFSTYNNGTDGTVQRVLKGGGTPQVLATALQSPYDVALDSTNVYFTEANAGSVRMVPQGGGTVTFITSATTPLFVVAGSSDVYFTDTGAGPSSGAVRKFPLGGGTVTALASSEDSPYGITLQGSDMYWANLGDLNVANSGAIRKAPK